MPQTQDVKSRIKTLEQQLAKLQHGFAGSINEAERQQQIHGIEQELQPLYERLGGEYVSPFNFNYKRNVEEDGHEPREGLW